MFVRLNPVRQCLRVRAGVRGAHAALPAVRACVRAYLRKHHVQVDGEVTACAGCLVVQAGVYHVAICWSLHCLARWNLHRLARWSLYRLARWSLHRLARWSLNCVALLSLSLPLPFPFPVGSQQDL